MNSFESSANVDFDFEYLNEYTKLASQSELIPNVQNNQAFLLDYVNRYDQSMNMNNDSQQYPIPEAVENVPAQSTTEEHEVTSQSDQTLPKKKRKRTSYTSYQILMLEREFQETTYLSKIRKAQLSCNLGVPVKKLNVWFQNRRMKLKKEGPIPPSKRSLEIGQDQLCKGQQWPMVPANSGPAQMQFQPQSLFQSFVYGQ